MGINHDDVKELVRRLDWKGVKRVLEDDSVSDECFSQILLIIWQSDSMVRRRPGDDGIKRDRFLKELKDYYLFRGVSTANEKFLEMHSEFLKIDRGYEEIHSTVPKMDSAKYSPEQRVAGIFAAIDSALRSTMDDLDRKLASSNGFLDIDRNLVGKMQETYDPESTTHGLTVSAGDVFMLEAYNQKWFDTEDQLVIPNLDSVEDGVVSAVVANLMNANSWRLWKSIDERVRFLNGSLTQISDNLHEWISNVVAEGGPKIPHEIDTAFEFEPDKKWEIFDLLANERFDIITEQNLNKLYRETNALEMVDRTGGVVALPPKGYVSVEEVHAILMFDLLTKMDASKANSSSLRVSEIIRGYAVLKNLVDSLEKKQKTFFPIITTASLRSELMRCGLTANAADLFIRRATFKRSSRDLYDHPLIKTMGDSFFIFGASLYFANFIKILFSSLSNEGANFEEKGGMYEAATIGMLREEGFNARKLKVRRGAKNEHEFDYDVAFVWDDYVFFIECKNRGLPMGNPVAIYHFNHEMHNHIQQVKRLRQALVDYPDILIKDFPEAVGKKEVFCLVNALPFAVGEHDGMYIIDDSILARFFSSPDIGSTIGQIDGKGTQIRTVHKVLWAGSKPTAAEFISYLTYPPQLSLAKENYEMSPKIEHLSLGVCAKVTDFRRRDLKANDLFKSLTRKGGGKASKADSNARVMAKKKKAKIKAAKKARATSRGRR